MTWAPCPHGVRTREKKKSSVAMLHAVEKTFLVAQPVQQVALTSPEACYQAVIKQWRP